MKYLLVSVSTLLAALSATAANSYVIPWYANPVATNVAYDATLVNNPTDDDIAAKIAAAWTTVSGAGALSGKTARVKTMGDTAYFRPKFYVLCTNGDIVEFTMAKDLSSAVWTNTLSAAKLASAAGATDAASDLQVSDDGRLAFLNYGGTWKALGYAAPTWSIVNDSTTTCPHGHPVMSDSTGTYVLHITKPRSWKVSSSWYKNDVSIGTYLTAGGDISAYSSDLTGGSGSTVSGNGFCEAGSVSEYLDLSAGMAHHSGYNDDYKIISNWEFALGVPTGGRTPRVIVHSSNLDSINKIMGGWDGAYEEVVIDSAEIPTGSAARTDQSGDGFWPSVKRLVLNVPNLTPNAYAGFPRSSTSTEAIASESRWEDFNFSNVKEFSGAAFQNFTCGGTLSLPSVVKLGFAPFRCLGGTVFENETPVEVLISPENKTVTNIANQAFSGQTNIWRVVIGGHEEYGVTFSGGGDSPNHFLSASKIREVEFTGGLPLFESGLGNRVFPSSQATMSFAFIIPREAKWATFIDGFYRPATDEEISSYMAANPGRYVPFGVVTNKGLFHTYNNQYIAYADSFGKCAPAPLTLRYDETRGSVTTTIIEGNPADALGRYEDGTVLRLTAVPNDGVSFARWYGDIGTNDAKSATITVTVSGKSFFAARFVNSWTIEDYDSGKKTATATDGNFRINLTAMDQSSHTFTLGKGGYGGLFDVSYTDNVDGSVTTNMLAGSSTVDLGGEFRLAGDDTPWVPTAFCNQNCLCLIPIGYANTVKTFYSPGTITAAAKALFWVYASSQTQIVAFETIVLDEPEMPGSLAGSMFSGSQIIVENLILWLPSIGSIEDGGLWASEPSQDFSSWDFSSVTNLTPKSMTAQHYFSSAATTYLRGRKANYCHGGLKLPALRRVERSDAGGSALSPMPYMTSLVLGGKTQADTVTSLANGAFAGNSSMTNLTIHADANITVGTDIFTSFNNGRDGSKDVVYPGHTPEYMTFTGAAPKTDVFANLLAGVGKKDRPVIITVTKPGRGWLEKSYICEPTAGEKALAGDDADKVFGVYRVTEGGREYIKAIFLWTNPPKGLILIVL